MLQLLQSSPLISSLFSEWSSVEYLSDQFTYIAGTILWSVQLQIRIFKNNTSVHSFIHNKAPIQNWCSSIQWGFWVLIKVGTLPGNVVDPSGFMPFLYLCIYASTLSLRFSPRRFPFSFATLWWDGAQAHSLYFTAKTTKDAYALRK